MVCFIAFHLEISLSLHRAFILQGPLALVAASMRVPRIAEHSMAATYAPIIMHVCNAALSLLFTCALLCYGFFVNRKQAWRTDGGTAVYGVGAMSLALLSTVLMFFYIPRQDEYIWLPSLIWAVVLWQSFLGWWWWVGAGSIEVSITVKEGDAAAVKSSSPWPRDLFRRTALHLPPAWRPSTSPKHAKVTT